MCRYCINFHLSEQQQYAAISMCISLVADFFISGQEKFSCNYMELKCIKKEAALLSVEKQFVALPVLRYWYLL